MSFGLCLIYIFFLLPPLILSFTPFKIKAPKSVEDSFMLKFFFYPVWKYSLAGKTYIFNTERRYCTDSLGFILMSRSDYNRGLTVT